MSRRIWLVLPRVRHRFPVEVRCQLQAMSTAARNLRPSHHTSGSPTSSQLNRPSPDAKTSASSIAFSIARSGAAFYPRRSTIQL
jgi:hypothetical protein